MLSIFLFSLWRKNRLNFCKVNFYLLALKIIKVFHKHSLLCQSFRLWFHNPWWCVDFISLTQLNTAELLENIKNRPPFSTRSGLMNIGHVRKSRLKTLISLEIMVVDSGSRAQQVNTNGCLCGIFHTLRLDAWLIGLTFSIVVLSCCPRKVFFVGAGKVLFEDGSVGRKELIVQMVF